MLVMLNMEYDDKMYNIYNIYVKIKTIQNYMKTNERNLFLAI